MTSTHSILRLAATLIATLGDDNAAAQELAAGLVAAVAHDGQVSRHDRLPYIDHVRRVAQRVAGARARTVAWLHDVVEDSDIGLDDLRRCGFSAEVVDAVALLTRDDAREDYDSYLQRLVTSANLLALMIKLADLQDNQRASCPPASRTRYAHAQQRVESALAQL